MKVLSISAIEFGKGFSETNIMNFKKFYLKFKELTIPQTVSEEFKSKNSRHCLLNLLYYPKKVRRCLTFFISFSYNYPFIYKIITFSCIKFAISDIYAYLCRC